MEIVRAGYEAVTKEFEILPSEKPYAIRDKLLAKPRCIAVEPIFGEPGHAKIEANMVKCINAKTGQDIKATDLFQPGNNVEMLVLWKGFKTVRIATQIEPGEGPFVVPMPVTRLEKYEFEAEQNELVLDGITYPFTFCADSAPIESHLIECTKAGSGSTRFHYTIWVEQEAQNLFVHAGYFWNQKSFKRFIDRGIPRLERGKISIPKLIEHLARVAKMAEPGNLAALKALETLLQSPGKRQKLEESSATGIERLRQLVKDWEFSAASEKMHVKVVLELLDKLMRLTK